MSLLSNLKREKIEFSNYILLLNQSLSFEKNPRHNPQVVDAPSPICEC